MESLFSGVTMSGKFQFITCVVFGQVFRIIVLKYLMSPGMRGAKDLHNACVLLAKMCVTVKKRDSEIKSEVTFYYCSLTCTTDCGGLDQKLLFITAARLRFCSPTIIALNH